MQFSRVAAEAVIRNGVHVSRIQGEEYTGTLYMPSTQRVYRRGERVDIGLYRAGSSKTYSLRGSSVSALTGYSIINSTLYVKQGDSYTPLSYSRFYVNGTVQTLYQSGGSTTVTLQGEEYTGTLYDATGGQVAVQGDMFDAALFHQGEFISGGLYSAFELAQLTTMDITALTV